MFVHHAGSGRRGGDARPDQHQPSTRYKHDIILDRARFDRARRLQASLDETGNCHVNVLVNRANDLATDVFGARTNRRLLKLGTSFNAFLAELPDQSQGALSKSEVHPIADIAEKVISHVDARVDAPDGSRAAKVELASLIYGMRVKLEDLARWSRTLRS
jgi:hypothetical protein